MSGFPFFISPRFMKHRKGFKVKKGQVFKNKLKRSFLAATLILFWSFVLYLVLPHPSTLNVGKTFSLKAAIVDHLSLSEPNQSFIQTSTEILETAGFTVDYHKGEEATVEFYRKLPTHGYGLIVLRVHSALIEGGSPPLGLFTSEPLSKTKYIYEQLTNQLVGAKFTDEETIYFGITPLFVKHSMNGRFENTIIIMMGCDGLTYTFMAEAFIKKGAKAYISWSGPVSAPHTDQATIQLLKCLITEKQTVEQAVAKTMKKVGPDPSYGSVLLYYPSKAGNYVLQSIASNLIIKESLSSSKQSLSLKYFDGGCRTNFDASNAS